MTNGVHVRLDNVTKTFGSLTAVHSVALRIQRGRTLALLGPSGCGKTTLLRMIAGLETPDAGTIAIGGRTMNGPDVHVRAEDRNVGMVFQNGALFPHMSVGGNVAYGLGRRPDRSRVEKALEMVDMKGFADRHPATLSGGQAQRAALARALAPQPAVLLLDEPLASLDADLRSRIRSDMAALLRDLDITAVFVTHDQEEAFAVGDDVAVMRDGQILQSDAPGEVYDRPADPWVARFVGDANLLDGIAEGRTARTGIGNVPLAVPAYGPCDVVVRPEYITLESGDQGTITSMEYYGHDTAYSLDVDGRRMTARALAVPLFRPGDNVRLSYAGPDTMAFPFSEPEPAGGA